MANESTGEQPPTSPAGAHAPHDDTLLAQTGLHAWPDLGVSHAHTPPILMSVNFGVDDLEAAEALNRGAHGYMYGRLGDPTCDALNAALAALEGGEAALVFGSGMAAISSAILSLAAAGDHLLVSRSLYSGSRGLLDRVLPRLSIETTYFDATTATAESLAAHVRPTTRLVFVESVTNPMMEVTDVAAMAEFAHAHGLKLLVDNTLTPPPIFRPIERGADLVVHSVTKYLNGHGDVLAGAVIGRKADLAHVRTFLIAFGGCLAPLGAYLVMRGLRTLPLRLRRHGENALAVARLLAGHPAVARVGYPGLPGDPYHALARAQFAPDYQPGGVLSFVHRDGEDGARRFFRALKGISFAASLGEPHSLVEYPPGNQFGHLSREKKAEFGVVAGLIRLAIGLEHPDDLVAELRRALDA